MLDTPHLIETTLQQTAVIRLTIPRNEIRSVMGLAIAELMSTLAAQGLSPAGPLFSHHLRMLPDTFDFEVGAPVNATVRPVGRVIAGQLPATKVARTVYHGAYEGLAAAWGEFDAWIRANDHVAAPDLWEVYLAGPESSQDPGDWRTEFNRPLIED